MKVAGIDIGSTTVKGVVVDGGRVIWKDYGRHNTRQAEKTLDLMTRMEAEAGLTPGVDQIVLTGSGAGLVAPSLGGRIVQEVVAVAAAVEALHPTVHFVSEIGGEDMKTIFFTDSDNGRTKQVYMQSACSGGTGTFIEKSARKLGVQAEQLAEIGFDGKELHRISAKCGIFAEADANSLAKAGVHEDEIIASLFDAVVRQNLATLTKGNTPLPDVLLLGGPNMFFKGLRQAWISHLAEIWRERGVVLPSDKTPADLVIVPDEALYYACLGCVEIARAESAATSFYRGTEKLRHWIEIGQHEAKAREGAAGLAADPVALEAFRRDFTPRPPRFASLLPGEALALGCDFGSTTVKALALNAAREPVVAIYLPSRSNPIEDAKALFAGLRQKGVERVSAVGITGYGKDLLSNIIGADVPVVETVAHATAAQHFFPDVDAICDVGGADVKIMLLRQHTVSDFRLNSQCSSGNGAFLQGVAERYDVRLEDYADQAFAAKAMPELMMGCGVFLQSDIVNQQRKGWSADEIMAALASVLPMNVWVYAGQFQNLQAAGRRFVLQGGTHRNLAVVKAEVDFICRKVPDAEIHVHPFAGEAGAFGAALLAHQHAARGLPSRFAGFDRIAALHYQSTASDKTTCHWCAMNCRRAFIDVALPGAPGRPRSKVPLAAGWERVITGNSCPRGLIEDATEYQSRRTEVERVKHDFPNLADAVREDAFR